VAVDVQFGAVATHRLTRPALPADARPMRSQEPVRIPFSMPAYARAFESKIGMVAARCE
jgi:hypothetical protein